MASHETFHRPGVLGRGVRLAAGMALLVLGFETLLNPADWMRPVVPRAPAVWLGVAVCFYFLSGVVNKGFGRRWGRWPQLVVAVLAAVAIVYNLVRTGNWWGQPLGALMFTLIVYVAAHLGLSFVLAGILAQPG